MSGVVFDPITHGDVLKLQQGVAALQSAMAAARQEIADVQSVAAGSVIKSVQRGVVELDSSTTTKTVTLNTVDMGKTVVHHLGVRPQGGGGYIANVNTTITVSQMVTLALTAADTLTIARVARPDSTAFWLLKVAYEVVEYH